MTTRVLYRDDLAERLGVTPKERVALSISQQGNMVRISCLVDGHDLNPEQEAKFVEFVEATGLLTITEVLPEKPVS